MLKRLRRSRSLRIVAAAAAAGALLAPPQIIGAQTPAAAISSITIVSSPADSVSYQAGETIEFSVQFTSAVRVAGSPTLTFFLGGEERHALFESVQGSEVLFAYTVRSPGTDFDFDGVRILRNAPTLGSDDAITDSQGRDADLDHASQDADKAHRVNLSTVTIEAAGTDPVPEDERARYILRRTGNIGGGLTVNLDHELDDDLSDPNPDAVSGNSAYVFASEVPRTVRFQPGRSTVSLEVPLYNDAEIEVVDGSLTMIVLEGDDYAVGQPASASRIVTDNNDVRVRVNVQTTGGSKLESLVVLGTSLTFSTVSHREKPPDRFWISLSTRNGTAEQQRGGQGGDFLTETRMLPVETFDWTSHQARDSENQLYTQWRTSIRFPITLVDDDVPEPAEYLELWLERSPATPEGILHQERLPHVSRVWIVDDDIIWDVEVHRIDGDTTTTVAEGDIIDTIEDGSESGDVVLDLVATSRYEQTYALLPAYILMELVGDTETDLDATYLDDFRRRDESQGTAPTQLVTLPVNNDDQPAQTSQRVRIRTIDDSEPEGSENFRVRLSKYDDDHFITFGASEFDVRILDNEAPPVAVTADADSIDEGDDVTFTLTRGNDSTATLPVALSIVESAGYIDYSGGFTLPDELTFGSGESTVSVTVPTQQDRVADGDGTIVATIQPGDGYSFTAEGRSASVDVLEGLPDLTVAGVTVSENRTAGVVVGLSQASDEAVSFSWTTEDGQGEAAATGGTSAGSGVDYRSGSGTVEIAAGVTSATIEVRTFNDAIDEPTETFRVVLSSIEGAAAADPRATVSIRDTDDPPQLKVENGTCPNPDDPTDTDTTCTEGEDGHMNFDVWLRVDSNQGASGKEVSVDWVARDYAASANTGTAGKARAGSDYVAGSGTLTFPPGVGRLTVQVELLDDEIAENTERFSFSLNDLENAQQYDSFAYGEILDDGDTGTEDPDAPTLSAADVSVAEGIGTARVQVRMSRASDRDVSFDWATADGTAASPADYTGAAGTATIAAGALSVLVDVPITQDLIYETDETFTVALSNPTEAALDSDPSATVTILDDDRRPSLSVRDASAGEESGPLRFTVERTGASAVAVSAQWATADGTAASPADYTAVTAGTVTIGPGDTSATISVTLAADAVDESDETLDVTLSSPVDATIGRGTATGTILDNDEAGGGATPRLEVSPTALSVDEGDSAGETYTVRLASAPSGNVTVSVTGASGSDVTVSPAELEFTTGNWDTDRTVTVAADHDDDHTDDTATLTNTAAGGGYDGASPVTVAVTVADDDRPALVISPTSVSVDEGDTSGAGAGETYTVRLATRPSANVAVTITGTAGTDVSLDTSSMTFTADDWGTDQTVTVTAVHDDDADDDTATLVHTAAGGGYSSVRDTVAVTVVDDDTARGPGLVLDPTSVEVPEGGGTTYTVRLASEPAEDVTVTITGTGADLTVLSVQPTVLTFTTTDWDTPRTVTLGAGIDADTEDVTVMLTHTAASDDTAYDGLTETLPVTIIDDGSTDHAVLEVNPTQLRVDEGGATGYNLRLRSQPSEDVTVTIGGAAGSDLEGLPANLTFTDVDWGVWQSVAMTAGHDPDIDDDTVTLTNTAAGGGYGGQSADVTVTIVDDDTAGVSLDPTRVTVTEGGAGATYTAVLDSQPSAGVTVTIGGAGSEVSLDETSLEFTSDTWNTPQTVTVTAVDDDVDEDTKTVTLTHTAASVDDDYHDLAESLRVDVVDDDTAGVVAPAAVTVTEGEDGVGYPVRLATEPAEDVTVTIGGVPHDDITLNKTSLVFTSGNWDMPQTVTVTAVDDDAVEDTERVTLPHRTASTGDDYDDVAVVAITTVTVRDNDDPPVQVSFGASSYEVFEGEAVDVSVVLSDPGSGVEVPITWTNQDGAEGVDYSTLSGLTFGSGETSKTFPFVAVPDANDESGESVLLGFDELPTGFAAGNPDTTTVSITDAVDAPAVSVSFGASSYSVAEGSSVTVTVVLSADPGRAVTVPITHTAQSDASDMDYSGVPESVTFASGDTSETFTLAAAHDSVDDDGESVLLGFGSELPAGFTAGDEATVSITDDPADVPQVQVSFEKAAYSVVEGDTETVTVELDVAPEREVEVAITATLQDGAGLADYSLSETSVTFAADETTATFTFSATQDGVDDDGESVLLGFDESELPDDVSEASPEEATVAIVDDDVPWVQLFFEQASYSVDEDSSVEVTVRLSADPERTVTVPITEMRQGGASSGDYSGVPESVTFAPGDTEESFTFTAASDTVDDDGESVLLGFGPWPPMVTAPGTTERPDEATVSITDDDDPRVQVSFGAGSYTVAEGASVTVTVELSAAPERQVEVDLTHTGQGDTSSGDYSLSATSVTFAADETTKTFTFTATSDDVDDDDESVVLGFGSPLPTGVSEGSPDEATVSITDDPDDVPSVSVSFGAASYTVAEGATVTVTVELSAAPERQVEVDLTHAAQGDTSSGDYSLSATSVTFAATETSKTFTLTAIDDSIDDDGDSVVLGFGSPLPTGVSEGDPDEATVTIGDDDVPSVQVSFGAGSYTVAEGASVTVTVELSAAPERQVEVDLTHTGQGDTSSGDYSLSATSVTFAADETTKTFTFTATSDDVDDDDESVVLGFGSPLPTGVSEGDPDEATVTIGDDDVPSVSVSFGAASYTVAEGASVTVTVELSAAPERQVEVDLTHTGQGDTSSGDYSLSATSVTFAADETTKTFTFTATSDDVDDDDESVVLGFGSPLPTGVSEGDPDEATVTIGDDDVPSVQVSFGAGSYTVAEGASVTVTVELSAAPERQVEVDLTHTGQGDTSSGDYSLSATSVTFAADETTKTFTFTATSDDVDDDDESVVLGFGSPLPTGVSEGDPDEATVTIGDDDVPSVQVSFGAGSYTVAEGASVTVTVELSAAPERQVEVDLTHTGQGDTSSGDYSLSATSVTFAADETTKTFTFTATSDDVDDDDESVVLGFGSPLPTGVSEGSPDEATVSITDDPDDVPSVSVSFGAASYTVAEGATVTVTVELSAAPERQVEVDLTHTGQGDTSSGDYSLSATSVTFAADETTKTFTFTAASDDVDDDDESVVLGFGTTLPAGFTEGDPDTATVSITDDPDDVPSVSVSFGAGSYTVAEGAEVSVSVVLSAAPERQVEVDLTHAVQGDTSSGDYSLSATSVTFAADETTKTFTFTATSDDVDDDDESVVLGFGSPLPTGVSEGSPDEATVTIGDDDVPSVSVSFGAASYTVAEGASVSVTVELSAAPERQVEVDLTHTGQGDTSSGDYSLSATSVTFAADETSKTFTFTATSDDVDDDDESVVLGFGSPLPTGVSEGSPDEATVTIGDDDVPSVSVSFGAASYTVAEGASVSVTVELSAAPERQVEVDLTHTGQGDTSSGDYSLSATSVTFAADETTKTFTFTATSDDVDDDDESVVLGFGSPLPTGVSEGSPDEATVTIGDDDVPSVAVSFGAGSYTVAEGASVSVTVELSAAPERQVEVDLTHTGQGDTSSGDYSLSATSVTFAADETTKTFTFTATSDDVDDDDESVVLGFGSPLPTGVSEGDPDEATVTIGDDDVPSVAVSFGAGSYTVAEGATVTVTVELSAAPERQVEVDLTHTGQGDTSSGDYSLSATSVTFAADETTKTFTFTATSDDVDDDDESVVLGFGSPLPTGVSEGSPDEATVSITDDPDDVPSVSVSFGAGSYTVAEGASVTVTVELSAAPERQVEVDLTHTGQGDTSSGDYSLSATSVTFAADETTKTFTFTAASDDVDDDDESVVLGFGTTLPAGFTEGDPDTATVSITDDPDDVPSVSVSFGAGSYTVAEGAEVSVSVVLSAAPERQVEVDLTHAVQGDTSSGDYSLSATSVTFAADETTKTFTFTATSDDVDDDDESVVLGFGSPLPTGVSEGSPDEATVTIGDDDVPSVAVSFGAGSYTVAEGASVSVTVELSAAPERQVEVDLTHTGQGDTSSGDYSLSATSVTFAADETTKTFTFTATSDDVDDDDESVVLGFGSPLPTGVSEGSPDEATVTIGDDDVPSVAVSFGAGSYTVAEGASVSVTVELSAAPERQVEVDLTHTGQGDTSSGDYSLSATSVTFAADETTKTFTFTATSDDVDDDDESVVLGFGSPLPTGVSEGSPDEATVSITDDPDDVPSVSVSFGAASYTVAEGAEVSVSVELSAAPERQVEVDLTHTGQGDTSSGDYSLSATSVTFAADETTKTFTFTATSDDVDDDDESVVLGFGTTLPAGFTEGSPATATVTIGDDDGAGLSLSPEAVSVTEGGSTASYTAVLDSQPTADVTVTIGGVPHDDITLGTTTLTFTPSTWNTPQTVTVTATDDTIDEDTETVTLTHTTSGGGYGTHSAEVTVTVTDDDVPAVRVSFEKDDHPTEEGAAGVGVALVLSAAPQADTTVEIRVLPESTASRSDYRVSTRPVFDAVASDYVQLPADGRFSVTFKAGKTLTDFGIKPLSDMLVEGDEQIVLAFDTLPAGVTEGSPDEATVTIADAPNDDNDPDDDNNDDPDDPNNNPDDPDPDPDDDDDNDDDPNDDDPNDGVCQRGVEGEAMFEVSVGPRDMIAEGDNSRGIDGERATVTVSTVGGATCSQDRTITLDLAGTAVQGRDYSVVPGTLTLPAGKTSVTATVTALDDGDDPEPTETIDITLRHEGEQIGAANVRISPCDNAGRGWAFSWLTIEGLRRAHRRPGNVTSPFTLRVCFSEPVSEMVINDYPYNANATLIIASHEVRPADEARHYVTGTLSNLREIRQDQIWLVDVTADYTGHFAVTLLGGRRFRALDGRRDNNHHHAYSWLWVTVP